MELLFILVIGLVTGSFLNAAVYRMANHLSLWQRSMCPHCKQKILNRDLIPVLSFILLRGKCRFCKKFIGWQYLLVEVLTPVLFVLAYLNYGVIHMSLVSDLLYISILIFILVFDFKYMIIPDWIIWPAFIVSLIFNYFLGFYWMGLILGILLGSGFFYLQHLVSGGKWIGWGDVKFGLLLGAMLGLGDLILTLLVAYVIGGFIALSLLALGKKKFGDLLPMGSFLAAAAVIVIIWGNLILNTLFVR
jgi:prepilin signal peptidase PulO-like enzyme (type II secretory pathway)